MRYSLNWGSAFLIATAAVMTPDNASAGITLFEDGGRYAKVGGRIQTQYRYDSPRAGDSTDDLFFRRLRFYIEGSVSENWKGKWQVDFGKDGADPAVKDAYMAYSGWKAGTVTIGNHYVPFSREALTSSKRQQLVERTFTGDHNFGVPDRQMGVSVSGGDRIQYAVGWYQAGIDPNLDDNGNPSLGKLDFDTRANDSAAYFGNLIAGRVDFYPNGAFKMAQGDFDGAFKYAIGASAFSWQNDDDVVVDAGADYDSVTGVGIDGAVRVAGLSVDAGYNTFTSETRGAVTDGLVADGEGDFDTWMLEGGYMLLGERLEGVIGFQSLDADAFGDTWNRTSVGLNLFFNRHKDKLQLTWEMSENRSGIAGNDADTLFLQWQHAF